MGCKVFRIVQAGKINPECVRMNNSMVRDNNFELADLERLVSRTVSQECRSKAGPHTIFSGYHR